MGHSNLRSQSVPRFALRRDEAAASLAISPSLFDSWVAAGRLPKGKRIGGVVLWDAGRLYAALQDLFDADEPKPDDGENPFDHLVA
jgi:predicted DNA-binding transcriptional regulator AlpA